MKRGLVVGIVVLLVVLAAGGAGGWYLYQRHVDEQFAAQVQPLVKGTTARLQAAVEMRRMEGITWKEAFERNERLLADIDKAALDLKSLSARNEKQKALVAAAEEYMGAAQAFIRAQLNWTRKTFNFQMAVKHYGDRVNDRPTSSYGNDYYRQSTERAKSEAEKAEGEAKQSLNEYIVATSATQRANAAALQNIGAEFVLAPEILDKHKEQLDKADQAQKR